MQARTARRGGGYPARKGGGGVENTEPGPQGGLASSRVGPAAQQAEPTCGRSLFPPAGKQPVLSVDWREVGVTPLASSALPQTEDLSSLRKLPQLHVAAKEVAPQSVPGLVAV